MTAVTPIDGLARRMPIVGKLKSGVFQGNRPRALDTFRLTTSSRPYAEDFAAKYGGTVEAFNNPKSPHDWQVTSDANEVSIVLIGEQGYSIAYELWSGGGCQRRCDGVTAEVIETTGPDSVEYVPTNCICDRKQVLECSLKSRLTFVLPDLPFRGGLVYESGSKNFAEEAQGMLQMIQMMQSQGINRGVLRLEQRRSSGNRKFTIATVGVSESLEALASGQSGVASLGRAADQTVPGASPALGAGEPESPSQASGSPSTEGTGDSPSPAPSPTSEGGGVEGEAAPPPDEDTAQAALEDIVDAEIVDDHGEPAERAQLIGRFQGICKQGSLDYEKQVRPWLQHHYGMTLSELPVDKIRGLISKLSDGNRHENQEARKKFKVSVLEHADASA